MTDSVASAAWRLYGGRADQFFPTNGQFFPTSMLIDHGQRHPAVDAPTTGRLLGRIPPSARLRKRFRHRLRQGDDEEKPAAQAGAQEPPRQAKGVPPRPSWTWACAPTSSRGREGEQRQQAQRRQAFPAQGRCRLRSGAPRNWPLCRLQHKARTGRKKPSENQTALLVAEPLPQNDGIRHFGRFTGKLCDNPRACTENRNYRNQIYKCCSCKKRFSANSGFERLSGSLTIVCRAIDGFFSSKSTGKIDADSRARCSTLQNSRPSATGSGGIPPHLDSLPAA